MNQTAASNRKLLHIEASADVDAAAAAADVYHLIADYRNGHARILPPRYFRGLDVDEGGYGDGTVIRYAMVAFGKVRHARARVSEPTPGRVLVETDLDQHIITTFTVAPTSASMCRVMIATEMATRSGLLGGIERMVVRSYLARVYAAELAQLNAQARLARTMPTPASSG